MGLEAHNNSLTTLLSNNSTTILSSLTSSHDDASKQLLSTVQEQNSPCAKESNSRILSIPLKTCPECDLKKKRCPHHKIVEKRIKPGIACKKCNLSKKRCEGVPCIRCQKAGQQCKAQMHSRKLRTAERLEIIHAQNADTDAFSIQVSSTTSTQDKITKIPPPASLATTNQSIQGSVNTTDRSNPNIPLATHFFVYDGPAQLTHWHSTNGYDMNQLLTKNPELLAYRQAMELEMSKLRVRNEELEDAIKKLRSREDKLLRQVMEMTKELTDLIRRSK